MTLHLLPNLLGPTQDPRFSLVPILDEVVNQLDGFFVETPKEARVYLKHFQFDQLKDKPMVIVDKRTENFQEILEPLKNKENWGVIVDAGLPCLADPGSRLVAAARAEGIVVVAYPGPSSIVLALMLSGLDSQSFVFGGYLPRVLDISIRKEKRTQVYIETPYNNMKRLEALLQILKDEDTLCIACDLLSPTQEVVVQTVRVWKKRISFYNFHKRPAIFLIKTS